ncbi:hypothetical protein [Enterococcus faecium]|uniref:hypothetical protein n=1 Tax=Enterococcus faecium TaxID=1352 RepID=UPI003F90E47D
MSVVISCIAFWSIATCSQLDNQRLLDKLHKHEQNNDKNAYIPNKNVVANKLLDQLREENEFYENNLPSKSKIILIYKNYSTSNNNNSPLQANQQIEKTSGATAVDYTEESSENSQRLFLKQQNNGRTNKELEKWWQLWK